jgi:threonine/homoserine/homoserine lactone efflux protein
LGQQISGRWWATYVAVWMPSSVVLTLWYQGTARSSNDTIIMVVGFAVVTLVAMLAATRVERRWRRP